MVNNLYHTKLKVRLQTAVYRHCKASNPEMTLATDSPFYIGGTSLIIICSFQAAECFTQRLKWTNDLHDSAIPFSEKVL